LFNIIQLHFFIRTVL